MPVWMSRSLSETSLCVVEEGSKIPREAKVASEPAAPATWLGSPSRARWGRSAVWCRASTSPGRWTGTGGSSCPATPRRAPRCSRRHTSWRTGSRRGPGWRRRRQSGTAAVQRARDRGAGPQNGGVDAPDVGRRHDLPLQRGRGSGRRCVGISQLAEIEAGRAWPRRFVLTGPGGRRSRTDGCAGPWAKSAVAYRLASHRNAILRRPPCRPRTDAESPMGTR